MDTPDFYGNFREQGYCVVEDFLTQDELVLLQQIAEILIAEPPASEGGKFHTIGLGEDRRFLRQRCKNFSELEKYLLSPRMRDFIATFLGPAVYLFNEQFVVKGPKSGAAFGWHQDSYYVGFNHQPYLTLWIALDDVNSENGALAVLPGNIDLDDGIIEHRWDSLNSNYVGYFGDDTGVEISCSAGSAVVFSSLTLHCSSANRTEQPRRAYICQYSLEPILVPGTGEPKHFAVAL